MPVALRLATSDPVQVASVKRERSDTTWKVSRKFGRLYPTVPHWEKKASIQINTARACVEKVRCSHEPAISSTVAQVL